MLVNEFSDGTRLSASEFGDRVRDRYCFSTSTLIRGNGEGALDNGRRQAFSHAACARLLWRFIDEAQWLTDLGANDLRSLPVRNRFGERLGHG